MKFSIKMLEATMPPTTMQNLEAPEAGKTQKIKKNKNLQLSKFTKISTILVIMFALPKHIADKMT